MIYKLLFVFLSAFCLLIPVIGHAQRKPRKVPINKSNGLIMASARAAAASEMFREIVEPPASIPLYILTTAKAIAVFSSRQNFGDFSGDEHGIGLVVSRDPKTGQWSAPIFLTIKGGLVDDRFNDGKLEDVFKRKDTDLILLAMNDFAAKKFLTDEVVLGVDVLVLPGSFGEVAKPHTDLLNISTGIIAYLYNRSGRFIGASIKESSVKQDLALNNAIYEESRFDTYIPPNKTMPNTILVTTDTLNQFNKIYGR